MSINAEKKRKRRRAIVGKARAEIRSELVRAQEQEEFWKIEKIYGVMDEYIAEAKERSKSRHARAI